MSYDRTEELKGFYTARFGNLPAGYVVSRAPGRVELAGNHTDHQGGKVISAAIGRRTHILAAPAADKALHVWMDKYEEVTIPLDLPSWTEVQASERNTSAALIRGMAAEFVAAGGTIGGCNMVLCSDIPIGSGLSSSSAFEIALGLALQELFAPSGAVWQDNESLALAGTTVEREYFGKPCGAQDQFASVSGGILSMDFASFPPQIEPINFDPANCEHTICIVDSRIDHSEFTEDFAQITTDMAQVAKALGATRLGDISPQDFFSALPQLRNQLGDRVCMRAIHFYDENLRVEHQLRALRANDFESFLSYVRLSGASSAQYLQNVSPYNENGLRQPTMLILGLCSHLLGNRGAWRIHGGGFGGGVLAIVPSSGIERFTTQMNEMLGFDACIRVAIGGPAASASRIAH